MLLYWINQNLNSSIEWKLWANVKILWVAEGAQNVQCVLCLGQGCSKSSFRRCSQLEKFTIHYISRHLCPGTLSMYYLKRPENKQGCECSDDVANKLEPKWIQMAISQKNPINIHQFHPQSSIFTQWWIRMHSLLMCIALCKCHQLMDQLWRCYRI